MDPLGALKSSGIAGGGEGNVVGCIGVGTVHEIEVGVNASDLSLRAGVVQALGGVQSLKTGGTSVLTSRRVFDGGTSAKSFDVRNDSGVADGNIVNGDGNEAVCGNICRTLGTALPENDGLVGAAEGGLQDLVVVVVCDGDAGG